MHLRNRSKDCLDIDPGITPNTNMAIVCRDRYREKIRLARHIRKAEKFPERRGSKRERHCLFVYAELVDGRRGRLPRASLSQSGSSRFSLTSTNSFSIDFVNQRSEGSSS